MEDQSLSSEFGPCRSLLHACAMNFQAKMRAERPHQRWAKYITCGLCPPFRLDGRTWSACSMSVRVPTLVVCSISFVFLSGHKVSRWVSLVSRDFRATMWSYDTQPQDGGGQAAHVDISEMQVFPNMRYQCISCPIQRICKDMQDLIVLGIFLSQHQWLSVIQSYVFRRDHCGERNDGLCVLLSIMIRISAKDDDDDGEGGAVLL